MEVFSLPSSEVEQLAQSAGLALSMNPNGLKEYMAALRLDCGHAPPDILVSRRMIEYYAAGKTPTKEALLAMAISSGLPLPQIEMLLHDCGYCLSDSLPNDMVVRWMLCNYPSGQQIAFAINEVLQELELPLIMTHSKE